MSNTILYYEIVDVDYLDSDAFLKINDYSFYFQFPDGERPTIEHALEFIGSEMKSMLQPKKLESKSVEMRIKDIKEPIKARLKSGGPVMMVYPRTGAEGITASYGTTMRCTWFDKDDVRQDEYFPDDMLEEVKEG